MALPRQVDELYSELASGPDLESARAKIDQLRQTRGDYPPVIVLGAQADFIAGNQQSTLDALRPIVASSPEFLAAALLFGHAAELSGRFDEAWRSFSGISHRVPIARQHALELEKEVISSWREQLEDRLSRGRLDEAEAIAEQLREHASDDPEVLRILVRFAHEGGDSAVELATRKELARQTSEVENLLRIAVLEIELGDLRTGLEHLESLFVENPDNVEIREQLESAKFLWRLRVLPPDIQELRNEPALNRAQFAVLLYWLVPEVRFSKVSDPPIANDILDHQWRDQILQVLSLRLIHVDSTLHRFFPGDPMTRKHALEAWLRLFRWSESRPACTSGDSQVSDRPFATESVCRQSVACNLISTSSDCLAGLPISGTEALHLFRRGLELMSQ